MLPDALKDKIEVDVAEAAAKGEVALEQTAVGLAQLMSGKAHKTASTAEAQLWFAAARHVVETALTRLPDHWRLLSVAGSISLAQSMRLAARGEQLASLAEAEAFYKHVLERKPEQFETLANLGLLQTRRGDLEPGRTERLAAYTEAEVIYRRLLKLQPNKIEVLANLGRLLNTRGGLEPARAASLKAYAEAETCYRRVLEIQPDRLETLGNLGVLLKGRGDLESARAARLKAYAEAETCYRRVLEIQPDHVDTLGNLGVLLKNRGDLDPGRTARLAAYAEAERCYRRVLQFQPDKIEVLGSLGVLLQARGDLEPGRVERLSVYAEAERWYRRVLELQPDRISALGSLGALLQARGDLEPGRTERLAAYTKAESHYRRVLHLQPDYVNTVGNLGLLLQTRGDLEPGRVERLGAYAEAEAYYRRVLHLQPDDINTLGNFGALEWSRAQLVAGVMRREHLAEAATLSARVLELQPTEARAMHNLMTARLAMLQLEDDAADWVERARNATELLQHRQVFAAVTRDPHFRTELSAAAWPLGPLGAVCHLKAGDSAAAVAHLDANMAMSLAEALALPERSLAALERRGHGTAASAYLVARDAQDARLQELVDLLQAPKGDTPEAEAARQAEIEALGREIERLRQAVGVATAAIRGINGFADFLRPESGIELIRAAAKERPLVYLCASPWGGHALIAHGEQIDCITFSELTDSTVRMRLLVWQTDYLSLHKAQGNRLRRNTRFPDTKTNIASEGKDFDQAARAFDAATRDLCRWLGKQIMTPLLEHLAQAGHARAVLLPAGQLS